MIAGIKDKGIRHCWCRDCWVEVHKNWYDRNKERQKNRVRINKKKAQAIVRAGVAAHLANHPCVDCGEADPVVLEFDHVRGKKDFVISAANRHNYSWPRVQAEIEKCEVRCANYHKRRHAKERKG